MGILCQQCSGALIVKLWLSTTLFSLVLAAIACGGGSSSKTPATGGTSPAGTSGPIIIAGGSTVTGADITVPAAPSPALNALVLGVVNITASGGSASNAGASVLRGTQAQVLMFGPGLNGNLQVAISGPNDIGISNIQGITSTKGTPGVEFVITVPGSAAIGARTVFLTNASGAVTTFTGGLEVQ